MSLGSSESRSVIDLSEEEEGSAAEDESDIRLVRASFRKDFSAPAEYREVKDGFGRSWSFR